MKVKKIQKVTFTIAAGSATGNTSLTGFTTLGQMVVWCSSRNASTASPVLSKETEVDVWVSSTSQVNAARSGSTGLSAITITAFIVEFDSDTTVSSGTWAMTSSETSDDVTLSTLNRSQSFAIHTRQCDGEAAPSNDSDPDGRLTSCMISSTTNLHFQRSAAKGACSGHYYVISSGTLSVQYGSFLASGFTGSQTITAVTLADSFLMITSRTETDTFNDEGVWDSQLNTTTTITCASSWDTGDTTIFEYFVVSDSDITTQRGTVNVGTGNSGTVTITSADQTLSIVKNTGIGGQGRTSSYESGNLEGRYYELDFNSATQIAWERTGGQSDSYISWEVVLFKASTPVAVKEYYGMLFNSADSEYLSSVSSLAPTVNTTMCFWANPKKVTGNNRVLGSHNGYEVRITNGIAYNDLYGSTAGTITLQTDTLYHIACTRASDHSAENYLNGVHDNDGSNNADIPTSASFQIGIRPGATDYYHGYIQDVRIYDRILSAGEIATIYASKGQDGIVYGLRHRWMLDEGPVDSTATGTGSIKDIGPGQLNMTPYNNPTYKGSWMNPRRFV